MLIEGWKAGKVLHIIILYELSLRVLGEKQHFPQNFHIGAEISLKHVMKTDSSCKGFKFGTWLELGHEKTTMEFRNYWIFKSLMQICKPFAHLRGKKDWNSNSAIVVSIRNLICMDLPPQCPWEFLFIVHKKEKQVVCICLRFSILKPLFPFCSKHLSINVYCFYFSMLTAFWGVLLEQRQNWLFCILLFFSLSMSCAHP